MTTSPAAPPPAPPPAAPLPPLRIAFEPGEGGRRTLAKRTGGAVRIVGLARLASLVPLLDLVAGGPGGGGPGGAEASEHERAFSPNPRLARRNRITDEIARTLEEAPDQFPLRAKGILLSASGYSQGDGAIELGLRGAHEGLVDGGHTLLAVGLAMLRRAMLAARRAESPGESGAESAAAVDAEARRARDWPTFAPAWRARRAEVEDLARGRGGVPRDGVFSALMPVEIIVPARPGGDRGFRASLVGISRGRNASAQVAETAMLNLAGLYGPLKAHLPGHVRDEVEWVPGGGGRLKAVGVVAVAFIALNRVADATGVSIRPMDVYSRKSALRRYERLIREVGASHPAVDGALAMLPDLLRLHDAVQSGLPAAYNRLGGRYGLIAGDRAPPSERYGGAPEGGPFLRRGHLTPVLYAFSTLMEESGGRLAWSEDPHAFLERHIGEIAAVFRETIRQPLATHDQVGRSPASYSLMLQTFENLMLEDRLDRATARLEAATERLEAARRQGAEGAAPAAP